MTISKAKNAKWGAAVREVLRGTGVKAVHVANGLMNPAMLHQYLHGLRTPKAGVVREVDRRVEQFISRRSGIAVFLDCTAMQEGLIPVDYVWLVKAMRRALEGLESRGLLVSDCEKRWAAHVDRLSGKNVQAIRRVVEAVVLASGRPLIDYVTGKTPITLSAWEPVRKALSTHGLGDLVRDPSAFQIEIDAFSSNVRKVLLEQPTTAIDRLGDEAELLGAALRLARSALDLIPRKFTDKNLIDYAKSIGVKIES